MFKNFLVQKCSSKNTKFGAGNPYLGEFGVKLKFGAPLLEI